MNNLYWPVYKNIEKETLALANEVHFDDKITKLNIFYKDEKFTVKPLNINSDFNSSLGSDIFSIKLATNSYLRLLEGQKQNSFDVYSYIAQYPQHTADNIHKKEEEVLQKQKTDLINSIEFQEFSKAGMRFKNKTNLSSAAQELGIWYFKRQIESQKTKKEQLAALYNSSEYIEYSKNNARNLENIAKDDINALCNHVGSWNYIRRIIWNNQRELDNMYFNVSLDVVVNKA
jgi:hypothetical protein